MDEEVRSALLGTLPLTVLALAGLALALARDPSASTRDERIALARLFLVGVALQCLHLVEELLTGFAQRWPERLGLAPWSDRFLVAFIACWIVVWLIAAAALPGCSRLAFFPVWFFALGTTANGVAHPALAALEGGYFPGLVTSPLVGVVGVVLLVRLARLTRQRPSTVSVRRPALVQSRGARYRPVVW